MSEAEGGGVGVIDRPDNNLPPAAPETTAGDSAPTPPAVESTDRPTLKERGKATLESRVREVDGVGQTAIERHINNTVAKFKNNEDISDASRAFTFDSLINMSADDIAKPDEGAALFKKTVEGIKVIKKGEDGREQLHTLKSIVRADDKWLVCSTGFQEVAIERTVVANAYLLDKRNEIAAELPAAQQGVAKLHLEVETMKAQGKSSEDIQEFIESQDPEKVNADIVAGAKDMSIMTSSELEGLIHAVTDLDNPEEIKNANRLLDTLNGTNIADPEAFSEIMGSYARKPLDAEGVKMNTEMDKLQILLTNPSLHPELRTQYNEKVEKILARQKVVEDLKKTLDTNKSPFAEYMDKVESGEVTPEQAKKVNTAIASGNVEQILDMVLDIESKADKKMAVARSEQEEELLKQKKAHRNEMIKKAGLGGLGLALFLLYTAVNSGAKQGG